MERESYWILYPAYGTYVGGALGRVAPAVSFPMYAGAVVAGHAVGRIEARMVPDASLDAVAAADIEPLPEVQVSHDEPAEPADADDAGSVRFAWWPFGRR